MEAGDPVGSVVEAHASPGARRESWRENPDRDRGVRARFPLPADLTDAPVRVSPGTWGGPSRVHAARDMVASEADYSAETSKARRPAAHRRSGARQSTLRSQRPIRRCRADAAAVETARAAWPPPAISRGSLKNARLRAGV